MVGILTIAASAIVGCTGERSVSVDAPMDKDVFYVDSGGDPARLR